jgi:hypothetical protein
MSKKKVPLFFPGGNNLSKEERNDTFEKGRKSLE